MFHLGKYTKIVLTMVALMAGWVALERAGIRAVQAQSAPRFHYRAELIETDRSSRQFPKNLETAVNAAAKGQQLVSLTPVDRDGRFFVAVFETDRP